jgi:glycosyltransferase involved in cell wall biosynthesis
MSRVGVVAIGRNEGARLRVCLESVIARAAAVVYVDSGSTDESVATARAIGADVVELDMSLPFTAARGRNAGFARLLETVPDLDFVQFVDGDCEVVAGWLVRAEGELLNEREAAVVCGRRRERFREATVYNRLCDIEWDGPTGWVKACGGDVLVRVTALRQVGGYDPTVIAAEDDELCVRLRREGWRIRRIDADMTIHDAAMTRFGQWWRRAVRCGHAYAEGVAMHGAPPERHFVRELRSVAFWGLIVPLAAFGFAWLTHGLSLLLLAGYPVLFFRIRRRLRQRGLSPSDATAYAASCVVGKFAETAGVFTYLRNRLTGRRARLIEYKAAAVSEPSRA